LVRNHIGPDRFRPALENAYGGAYAPELNKRCRPHLKPTNKSYRIDETYINVKGEDKYLYRALDSTGQTIDFLLTAKRDTAAAKRFLRKALDASGNPMPRVMNVDKNPAYPATVEALKAEGAIPRRVALRRCKYLNNVIEQDHRTVKKRVWLAKGYGSFQSAWRTLQGVETLNMIRKGRVRWLAKRDTVGSSASCSDSLPNPDSRLTNLYWPESLPPRTSQRSLAVLLVLQMERECGDTALHVQKEIFLTSWVVRFKTVDLSRSVLRDHESIGCWILSDKDRLLESDLLERARQSVLWRRIGRADQPRRCDGTRLSIPNVGPVSECAGRIQDEDKQDGSRYRDG
jgi:transposase-like protein